SRRRHTRSKRDWSSDVCSSDLVSCPLRHRRVEAVATLFDSRKMKSGGIRDRLKEVGIIQIIIGSGNCRMLPNRQSGNRLREGVKIGRASCRERVEMQGVAGGLE